MRFINLTFLFLLLATGTAFAKKVKIEPASLQKNESGKLVYESVVEAPGSSQKELYNRMKTWVLANVKTIDNNITFDDANFETIVTTPTIRLKEVKGAYPLLNQLLNFKLTISFKDGKFKIDGTSFFYAGQVNRDVYKDPLDELEIYKMFESKVTKSIDDGIAGFMDEIKNAGKTKSKDW